MLGPKKGNGKHFNLSNSFLSAFHTIKDLNLFPFYHYAIGTYTVVRNILKGFGESVRFIVEPYLEISNARTGIISHDGDFDFRLTLNMRADPASVKRLVRNLLRRTRRFGFTCKILGFFMGILTTVIRNMYAGYVGLILALVKFRREWDRIPSLISEYESLFETDEGAKPF